MRSFAVLIGLFCLVWCLPASGADLGTPITGEAKAAFLSTWGQRLHAMRSLHMLFAQEKQLRMLQRPLLTQGELWLKGEKVLYLLRNAMGVTELVLRLDKQKLQTYYPLLQTLEIIELRSAGMLPMTTPLFSPDLEALAQAYTIDLFQADDLYTLHLTPKDPAAPVQALRLALREFQPQSLVQEEKSGTRVTMRITAFTMNADVSESQFELHIPPGTKVTSPLK